MKILLSGASGLLGSAISQTASEKGYPCQPFTRTSVWQHTDAELVQQMAGHDWFIHAAANTNVEQCEVDPDSCYRDNFLLTERLARAAAQAGLRFVFMSSTGVYGAGGQESYKEYQTAHPTTHHHTSKYLAENIVQQINPCNLVLRTGWLFGGDPASPKNFVARRIDEAKAAIAAGGIIKSNTEQRGVPCSTRDVAARILLLMEHGAAGLFNCVNTGSASRFDYVRAIINFADLPVEVQPTSAGNFNRKANVSNNEMAVNWKMDNMQLPAMPSWEYSLQDYIQSRF